MKLKFKHQRFQEEAAKAVCDVFAGQPRRESNYMIDPGQVKDGEMKYDPDYYTGFKNYPITALSDEIIFENIQAIQRANQIKPSDKLEGHYNLTIEMETGVGKTYTYIKTIFELNKRYGWCKFIVVVPSVAIREGVYKSFDITQDHFVEDYGKKVRFFIYNSKNLTDIEHFASDSEINVMIINSQAFNATGKDARRIDMKLDTFKSRRPIDVIAKTNPIMIIDEPQRVEGAKTKEGLKKFRALFTLRYSATHRKDSVYNMIYRLDAMEAYNKRLVKKIAVKGISMSGTTATEGYLYLEGINLYKDKNPTANVGFDVKGAKGVRQVVKILSKGANLYDLSDGLEEYKKCYLITDISGVDNSVSFENGTKLFAGDIVGTVNEDQIRRVQIRETILSHIEKERELFNRGIKVLSLFFIDEVEKYRVYEPEVHNGVYADMFEEEYASVVGEFQKTLFEDDAYLQYLKHTDAKTAHDGYFSRDKKGYYINSKTERGSTESGDADAYDLIMKDKERLLDRKTPLRFIFSHSALREGWDNPNVFQICTLKQSAAEVNKRQEVGRGLRICVNDQGDRMDTAVLGEEVHKVNVLTVIASESYDSFAKGLQSELAKVITDRPLKVNISLFADRVMKDAQGENVVITTEQAQVIYDSLIENGYVKKGELTEKYYSDKVNGAIEVDSEVADFKESIINTLDSIYNPKALMPEDVRKNNVTLKLNSAQFHRAEFQKLWKLISPKSYYIVRFEEDELIRNTITSLNDNLRVSKIYLKVTSGSMSKIASKRELEDGDAFKTEEQNSKNVNVSSNANVKYDLIGKITENTGLTRRSIVKILSKIETVVFEQFKNNPEEFIIRASELINEQKANVIIQHITYSKLDQCYDSTIFTDSEIKGRLGVNAIATQRHLFDHVIYDSKNEKDFAEDIDTQTDVAVYVKLPKAFYINTPVGKYNPDWAIAFEEGAVKHIYFIAETKGEANTLQFEDANLQGVEKAKKKCAEEHFKTISTDKVKYGVVSSYKELYNIVTI